MNEDSITVCITQHDHTQSCTQSYFSYFSVNMSFLRPILTCSMCYSLWFSVQQLICITWWVCRCMIIRGLHCDICRSYCVAVSCSTWDESAAFGLPAGFNKSWEGGRGTHPKSRLWPSSRLWGTGWLMDFCGLTVESGCQICTSNASHTPC